MRRYSHWMREQAEDAHAYNELIGAWHAIVTISQEAALYESESI